MVRHICEVFLRIIFPAVFKALADAAAAFAEPCVAHFPVISQRFSAGVIHSLRHFLPRLAGDALITLTMVVGTYIKLCVVLAVVPFHQLVHLPAVGEQCAFPSPLLGAGVLPAVNELPQKPAAAHHGVCPQQRAGCGGAHFRRYYAFEIFLQTDGVDRDYFFGVFGVCHYGERSTEPLAFMALPMETYTDGDTV